MSLWKVRVGQVSIRFVDAESADDARGLVIDALIEGMDLEVRPANSTLEAAYDAAGPIKRRRLLRSLDSLVHVDEPQRLRRLSRELAREVEAERKLQQWVAKGLESSPPVNPGIAEAIVKAGEVAHLERNMKRLHQWDQHSALHDI